MNTYSLTPLLRHAIGFDHFDQIFNTLNKIDESAASYPPYNIEKLGEHDYVVTIAVAGFAEQDIAIVQERGTLVVRGRIEKSAEDKDRAFLHKGIATRSFERKFNLADHVRVTEAALQNGLLAITLHREVPEEEKPRTIEIKANSSNKVIAGKK